MNAEHERRPLVERAWEAGRRVVADREHRSSEAGRPHAPGDLVLARSTAELPVEWAVLDVEAGAFLDAEAAEAERMGRNEAAPTAGRLLVVPADLMPLRGPADVATEADPATPALGPLTLRCAWGLGVEADRLDSSLRGGRLPGAAVREARERYRVASDPGSELRGTPLEREAAADPEYRHWAETVLRPAREALAASDRAPVGAAAPRVGPEPTSLEARRRRRRLTSAGPWAIAASVLLVIALGLVAGLLRQRATLSELEVAQDRLAQDLTAVRAERNTLREERERLDQRIGRLTDEHLRELAERERAAAEAERTLRNRLADLQERLREAVMPRAFVNPPSQYLVPVGTVRSPPETAELPTEDEYLLLLLEYIDTEPFDSYRLELYREGEVRPVWTADGLVRRDPLAFRVGLPRSLLEAGLYRLDLFGVREGGGAEKVAEYQVRVGGETQ